MSNTIKLKRGTSTPSTSDISNGEVAIDTSAKKLYINDSGTVKEIGGSGTIAGATGLDFNDNVKVRFGTGNDLEIYHDGSHSYIADTGTGRLHINTSQLRVNNAADNEILISATEDSAVELYYNGTKKFETTSTGVTLTGHINFSGLDTGFSNQSQPIIYRSGSDSGSYPFNNFGHLIFQARNDGSNRDIVFATGASASMKVNRFTTDGNLDLYGDNQKVRLGASNDLQIYHDGTNSFITNATGYQYLKANNLSITSATGTESMISGAYNGAVQLYYDNSKKFETTSSGVTVTGNILPEADNTRNIGDGSTNFNSIWASNRFRGNDNVKLNLGNSQNFIIRHDGTNNLIESPVGDNLKITMGVSDNANEVAATFNYNGAVELYYDGSANPYIKTTAAGAWARGELRIFNYSGSKGLWVARADTDVGTTPGVRVCADSSKAFVIAYGGSLRFQVGAVDGTAGNALIIDQATKDADFSGNINVVDNKKLLVGTGDDLQIYHDGSHSYIKDAGTGKLRILSNEVVLGNAADTESLATFIEDGAVNLYYDGTKKLETSSAGVKITGELEFLTASDVNFTGSNYHAVWDASASALELKDNTKLIFGTGDDLQIYHDGSSSYIDEIGTGSLKIQTNGTGVDIQKGSSETIARFIADGAVELYHNNSKKFETTADGIKSYGSILHRGAEGGSAQIRLEADEGDDAADMWRLIANTDGTFGLQNYAGGGYENTIKATGNGNVELYYNNAKKLETASNGINVTGKIDLSGYLYIADSQRACFGAGPDLQIYHDGTHSRIVDHGSNATSFQTGELRIHDLAANEYIAKFVANGAVELYYDNSKKLETTSAGVLVSGNYYANDDNLYIAGTANDMQMFHNGLNSYITNSTGWLVLGNGGSGTVIKSTTDENGVACTANGAVELYYDGTKQIETLSNGVRLKNGHLHLNEADSMKILLGASDDLQIYHDGTNSYLINTTGFLRIKDESNVRIDTDAFAVNKGDNSEAMIVATANGAVDLYYDNSAKLETTSYGVFVSGTFRADVIDMQDNKKANWGNDDDLEIYHDGSNSYINNTTGILRIRDSEIRLCNTDNETYFMGAANGAAKLYYDDAVKFKTSSSGVDITGAGTVTGGNFRVVGDDEYSFKLRHTSASYDTNISQMSDGVFRVRYGSNEIVRLTTDKNVQLANDSGKLQIGASQDLQIYHDGSNSYIDETGTGSLLIKSGSIYLTGTDAANDLASFVEDGAVSLYYDDSKKLETQSTGVKFLATDGSTVRGRVDNSAGVIGIEHTVFYPIQVAHNGTDATWGTLAFAGISGNMNSDGDKAYIQFVSHPRHRDFGSVHLWYGCSGNTTGNTFDWAFTVYNAQANTGYTSNSTTFTITTGSMGNGQLRKLDISSNLPTVAAQDMVKVKIVYDELQGGSQVLLMGMQVTEYTSA